MWIAMDHIWTCRCCGKQFNTLPLSFAPLAPDPWFAIPEAERDKRTVLGSDQCIIDDQEFYLRGCLDISIINHDESFSWGVWVSLSEASFARVGELWEVDVRANEPPFFGWLCTELSVYPPTRGLKTNVRLRNSGQRPFIELEPTAHPLAVEQRNGISLERVEEIAAMLLPRH
jgi:hypothetical protein